MGQAARLGALDFFWIFFPWLRFEYDSRARYSVVGPPFGVIECDALLSAWAKWPVLFFARFDSAKLNYEGSVQPARIIEEARE
jgi:hypothetical protein